MNFFMVELFKTWLIKRGTLSVGVDTSTTLSVKVGVGVEEGIITYAIQTFNFYAKRIEIVSQMIKEVK